MSYQIDLAISSVCYCEKAASIDKVDVILFPPTQLYKSTEFGGSVSLFYLTFVLASMYNKSLNN